MYRIDHSDAIIRKAKYDDLNSVMSLLKAIGNSNKNPNRGFMVTDYTLDDHNYLEEYARILKNHKYNYVYEEKGKIIAFLLADTKEEWLNKTPQWISDVHWHPLFDQALLHDFAFVNQTAMYPEFGGQGIGSLLMDEFIKDLTDDGQENILAETIIAPIPNFASLNYRLKQNYELIGTRYEYIQGKAFTTLIYHKSVKEHCFSKKIAAA